MQYTTNRNLVLAEDLDPADFRVFVNDNMNILDVHNHDFNTLLNLPTTFTPPIASPTQLGGVKIGSGLTIDGTGVLSTTGGGSVPIDSPNFTGVPTINGNEILSQSPSAGSNNPLFIWSGTQSEYDAIATKDSNTLYFITGA